MSNRCPYVYRRCAPVDHDLESFTVASRSAARSVPPPDEADHFFDGVVIKETDLSDLPLCDIGVDYARNRVENAPVISLFDLPVEGVPGGCCTEKKPRTLYVNKNNYNPPVSTASMLSSVLDGSYLEKDCEFSPPVPLTLLGVREWCSRNVEKTEWQRKDGDLWTAPACTVGIFRRRDNGKVAGFVPCNSWNCDVCGPIKKNRLIDKTEAAFGDRPVFFLTLNLRVPTGKWKVWDQNPLRVDGYNISGYVPQHLIAGCFQRFRSILSKKGYFRGATGPIKSETHYVNKFGTHCVRVTRERLPDDQAYFYVKEFSPSKHSYKDGSGKVTAGNRRHYHILTTFDIPEAVIRDAWWRATNKTSTNVKFISETEEFGALRARYVAKYINKSMPDSSFHAGYLRHERRYGKSVGFFTMSFDSLGTCFFQGLVKPDSDHGGDTSLYSSLYSIVCEDPMDPFYYSLQEPLS